jgi:hypothetical protein
VQGAEKTAESQLRAYVGIISGQLDLEVVGETLKPRVTIRIRNFGQTPAYEVRCKGGLANAGEFSESLNDRLIGIVGKNTIFPQSDQRVLFTPDFNIPPGDEPFKTFVFGFITYRDAFGHTRQTDFRFTGAVLDRPSVPGSVRADLAPCEEGNESN